MTTIQFFTVAISGSGAIDCQQCSRKVYLPDNAHAVLVNDGKLIRVRSADDGSLLHQCGRKLEWRCVECNRLGEKPVRATRRRPMPETKCLCGGSIVQRELASITEHLDDMATAIADLQHTMANTSLQLTAQLARLTTRP